jgi:pilus assembly protein CpaB
MNPKRLILALVIALCISGLFTYWLSQRFAKPRAAVPVKRQYVAAATNLDAGEMLHPANLSLIDWPDSSPLTGAFAKPEDVVGRIVLFPLAAGQPILERQLSAVGTGAGITVKIPEGMRAIALRSDDVVGVAGFILPGTYVDVLVTYHTPNSPDPVTATILQDVQVLAVGQKFEPDPEGKASPTNVVTLLVKPEDAAKVVLASSQGIVHFVLRNGSDREKVNGQVVQLSELSGAPAPHISAPVREKAVKPQPASAYVIETVSGTKQSTESFK